MENFNDYYNLIERDISRLAIQREDNFNCALIDEDGKQYTGFILARSEKGNAYTLCEIDFQKSASDNKYQPRLIFRRTDNELKDKKVYKGNKYQRISFKTGSDGYRKFWEMIAFLFKFRELISLDEFFDKYTVVDSEAYIVEFKYKEDAEKIEELKQILTEADLNEDQIKEVLQDKRKETLNIFRKLLEKEDYWEKYSKKHKDEILGKGEEAVWHHFLKEHDWILGLNADIRFIRDLISEVEVGIPDTSGSGSPTVDVMGLHDYTVLVELKTPNTRIFTLQRKSTARANTWSFTDDLIDGVSQCLGQKFDWDKSHKSKNLVSEDDKLIDQNRRRTVDPRSVFIIGNKSKELPESSKDAELLVKRDTFERFRRNNRNVDIITFDELYERAYFTIYGKEPEKLKYKEETNSDIPF